jgi:hypothetical protein
MVYSKMAPLTAQPKEHMTPPETAVLLMILLVMQMALSMMLLSMPLLTLGRLKELSILLQMLFVIPDDLLASA